MGGYFTLSDGKSAQLIAVDAETGQKILWSYSIDPSSISSLAVKDGILYVGGSFREIGNQQRKGLAALDVRTGAVLGWNPFDESYSLRGFKITSLVLGETTVYACGTSTFLDGSSNAFLAEFSLLNGAPTSWQPALGNRKPSYISMTKHGLIVGSYLSNTPFTITLFDRASGAILGSPIILNGGIHTMTSKDSILYIGGEFSTVNNTPRKNLAAIHLPSGTVTDWSPYVVVPEKPQGARKCLCLASKSMVKNTQKSVDLSKNLAKSFGNKSRKVP